MIPKEFLERMESILGTDFPAFAEALMKEENIHGVRYNAAKIEKEHFLEAFSGHLTALPYICDGFISDIDKIGRHPLHHAGALYAQDPGAMAPVCSLNIERGWFVADFCAAPGGKSAQLASAIGDEGLLISNEVNTSRAKVLAGNLERLGVRNAAVTSVSAQTLATWFPEHFDLVLVDAPCSGEGMFRKYDYAQTEWSAELVPMCAARQKEILEYAEKTVKAGGYLLYSTCTFSVEENEQNIDTFLEAHPDFSVCAVKESLAKATADGIAFEGARHPEALKLARRFYPHLSLGEGQFMCLMRKDGCAESLSVQYKSAFLPLSKEEAGLAGEFLQENLVASLKQLLPQYMIRKQRDMLYIVPEKLALPPHGTYLSGVALGTLKKGRIEPHHQFFSAMGVFFSRKLELSLTDNALLAYLHGDTIETALPNGYAAVTVLGAPIGGVKVVDGIAKNHYPKGLRTL